MGKTANTCGSLSGCRILVQRGETVDPRDVAMFVDRNTSTPTANNDDQGPEEHGPNVLSRFRDRPLVLEILQVVLPAMHGGDMGWAGYCAIGLREMKAWGRSRGDGSFVRPQQMQDLRSG